MTIYLLDVNVLLALSDPMHIHHEAAHRWFAAKGQSAWATSPITENGFVRIASHPNYPNRLRTGPARCADHAYADHRCLSARPGRAQGRQASYARSADRGGCRSERQRSAGAYRSLNASSHLSRIDRIDRINKMKRGHTANPVHPVSFCSAAAAIMATATG